MTPEPTDPATAAKLVQFVEALRRGDNIDRAADHAGISRELADQFLESTTSSLKPGKGQSTNAAMPKRVADHVVAFTDGASRGNPGPGACAVIMLDAKGEEIYRRAKLLGKVTNNAAEYQGVILAGQLALALKIKKLEIRMDSELVVKQLSGEYKVKNEALKPLFRKAMDMLDALPEVSISHVPRADNKHADKLANAALDGKDLDGE